MSVENYDPDVDVLMYGGLKGHELAEEILAKKRISWIQEDSKSSSLEIDLNKLKKGIREVREFSKMKPFVDQYLSCRNVVNGRYEISGPFASGTSMKVDYHLMGHKIEEWFNGYDNQRQIDEEFQDDLKGSLEFIAGDHELVISEEGKFRYLSKDFMEE